MKSFSERSPVIIGLIGITAVIVIALAALNYQKLPFLSQGKDLLGLFRRRRGSVHRRRRRGLRFPHGQGVQH